MRLRSLTLQVSEHSTTGDHLLVVLMAIFSGWTPIIIYFLVSKGIQVTLASLLGPSGLPCLSKSPGSEMPVACLQDVSYLSWRSERCNLCKDTHWWSRGEGMGPEPQTLRRISHRRIEKLEPGSGHQEELYTWKRLPSISFYICSRKSLEFTVKVQTREAWGLG